MKKLFKCAFCGKAIKRNKELFILKEDIEDWDSDIHITKLIKADEAVCAVCLMEYIEDTERVPETLPQIVYRYVSIEH